MIIAFRLRRPITLILGVLLALGGSIAFSKGPKTQAKKFGKGHSFPACSTGGEIVARPFGIEMPNGEIAEGLYAVPGKPTNKLVIFAHGYGHSMWSWEQHIIRTAREGAVAVVMDYRGIKYVGTKASGLPNTLGWPAEKGAEDLVAAAQFFEEACHHPSVQHGRGKAKGIHRHHKAEDLTIGLFGVSMGGNMSGLAAATQATRSDGSPLFDFWIDVEGVANIMEIYIAARAIGHSAANDIETDTGGPIEATGPAPYQERTVALHADGIAAAGVPKVILVHGLDDGLVPYNQSRELQSALKQVGVPTEMFSIGRRSCQSEQDTTISGYLGGELEDDYNSFLAGHASEASETSLVMIVAFDRLRAELGFEWETTYDQLLVADDGTHAEYAVNGDWTPESDCEGGFLP
jgi:acetyl esterase/lipase